MKTNKFVSVAVLTALAIGAPCAVASAPAKDAVLASPAELVEFSVYLPLRNQAELERLVAELHDTHSPKFHQWLQPADFLHRFGPTAEDLSRVESSLQAHGFTVLSRNAHGMRARGPASAVASTFGTTAHKRTERGRTRYLARGEMRMPSEIAAIGPRIVGLESVSQRRPHSHLSRPAAADIVDNRYGVTGSYWFDDLKQAYDYPAYSPHTDGTGVSVAVLMADLIFPDDVAAAFNHEKFTAITGKPVPTVTTVPIDGGGVENGGGSFEASLDVQQVLGGAPGSNVTLVSIPDLSDQSVLDGYAYIVDSNSYDIVNSSFGGCELGYTAAYNDGVDYTYILQAQHEIFVQGNAQGITFVASSGDAAGLACPSVDYFTTTGTNPTFVPSVENPADDPAVTAVGGGNLVTRSTPGSLDSAYVRESAYADPEAPFDPYGLGENVSGAYWGAGGGVSVFFKKPLYQALANTGSRSWRTVPDVGMQVGNLGFSGDGCEATSCGPDDSSVLTAYGVGLGGGYYDTIGTSVASPEFVGALALFEQKLGRRHRLGNVNYYLYTAGFIQTVAGGVNAPGPLQYFHRRNPGYNGVYQDDFPSYNYNYVYGNGSPDVRKLFGLTEYPAAGLPRTPTNP